MNVDVERFWREGFLVIPGMFEPKIVEKWRRIVLSRDDPGVDLMSVEALRDVLLNEKLITAARQILDAESPVYFGDSTFRVGFNGWGFHKDNSDRLDFRAPDWQEDRYPIIRFAIYAQEHPGGFEGIEFRRGSHLVANYWTGECIAPEVNVGDVLVWNLRTSHSAGKRKVRLFNASLPHHPIIYAINRRFGVQWMTVNSRNPRVAIFLSFGKDHPLLDRHIEYLKQRLYAWKYWEKIKWPAEAEDLARCKGIKLVDPTRFEYDGRKLYREWHPIPY